jgi:hypothetical protein
MRRARLARTRAVLGAIVAGLALTAVISPHDTASATTAPTQLVELRGGGAWSVYGPLVAWQNDLSTASTYINLAYTPRGTTFGREDVVNKAADFVISGTPFTTDELKKLGGSKALISAPVQATAIAVYVEPTYTAGQPVFQFFRHRLAADGVHYCDPDDPTTWPPDVTNPDDCYARETFNGPVRIPNANLGAMLLNTKVGGDPPTSAWNNPDVLRALGLNPDAGDAVNTAGPDVGPGTVNRSDPDELNYYLGAYVKAVAPDAWAVASNNLAEPTENRLPSQGWTRDGAEQQIQLLASHGCGVTGDGCGTSFSPSGGLAPTPPALITAFRGAFQSPASPQCCQPIFTAQVQNQHQDWVDPSPEAISKAVEAGGETPFYALNHDVPGAYPLTWVDRMYVPSSGLSVAKTEGDATLMRYLATTGQEKEAAALEGRLSPALVAQTLSAADAVVQGNCVGTDREIVKNSDPGPLAPPDATAMRSIGPMLHCVAVVPSSTTTTIAATGSNGTSSTDNGSGVLPFSPSSSGSGGSSSGGSSSGATSSGSASSANNTGSAAAANNESPDVVVAKRKTVEKHQSELVAATNLPLPIPTGQTGRDRLVTFLLGVGLYFLLRKPATRLFQRLSR